MWRTRGGESKRPLSLSLKQVAKEEESSYLSPLQVFRLVYQRNLGLWTMRGPILHRQATSL